MKHLKLYKSDKIKWRQTEESVPLPASLPVADTVIHLHSIGALPLKHICMIPLDVFGDTMFDANERGIVPYHEAMVTSPTNVLKGGFNDNCLRYMSVPNGEKTNWPMQDHKNFEAFSAVLNLVLEKVAGKPKQDSGHCHRRARRADFSTVNNPCGFFSTVRQMTQSPHTDTNKKSIAAHRKFGKEKKLGNNVLPWHLVIPLSKGGRIMFFWGVEGHSSFQNTPVCVYCPPNCLVMWR